MDNLFKFKKHPEIQKNDYVIHTTAKKQYWKRFFSNKISLTWFIIFCILFASLLVALFLVRNSATKSIDPTTNLVNNLPSSFNPIITKNFNRGPEIDFIREIAQLEEKQANLEIRNPLFVIYFDSAKEIGGDQTIYTDIITLAYNPYDLINAINSLNKNTNLINVPSGLYMGTNNQGIDIYARSIITLWMTILIIILAIFINIFIGFNLAVIVNLYQKNLFVNFLDKLITAMSVIPEIIWVFLLSIFIGTQWYAMLISLSFICWVSYYKLAKEKIYSLLNKEFILVAKTLGSSNWKIAYWHIFNYLYPEFLILFVERFSINILIVSSLAFLDFIIASNAINIGTVLKEGIILFFENPSYLLLVATYIILFALTLKLLSGAFANAYNPRIN
ncbi:peptide ABC transporter permease [Metamycoplasma alkalescens]|uniref:Peptide/nickel transport system permease protein n=1 Tax=Metamycoplasma alkalescens TaxID=45363 RepID=A0A318U563_9BACT|nr:peptide ABC transporter permease [Metamycoplasma alkalescens]PYF43149.1 peptide/nickel transport system permease protein [Metamycoplasma alkalescens]